MDNKMAICFLKIKRRRRCVFQFIGNYETCAIACGLSVKCEFTHHVSRFKARQVSYIVTLIAFTLNRRNYCLFLISVALDMLLLSIVSTYKINQEGRNYLKGFKFQFPESARHTPDTQHYAF